MSNKNVPASSFMNLFREIVYDKEQSPNESLDIWDAYVVNPFNKREMRYFLVHRVEKGQTWVKLARTYYDDERLWWIIPLFNDLENPFTTLEDELDEQGIVELQILKPQFVSQLLLSARQKKIIEDRQSRRARDIANGRSQ
jgi:predicted hydrolase (HD superfamily)